MKDLFNSDNWFWQHMSDIADMILLSLLWLVSCVPVVTSGVATVALYYVMLKKVRGEADEGIWRLYVRSFRQNFKQGLVVGLLLTALGVLLYIAIQFYAHAQGALRPLFGSLTVVGGIVGLLLLPYVIGQMAQFQNTLRNYVINAFYFSIRHFLSTLGLVAVFSMGLLGLWFLPPLVILVPGLVALGHAAILAKVFDRYAPQSSEESDAD